MLDILKQLGTDQSIFYQFVIIIIVFMVSKMVFIKHLQSILETREEKTHKLEGSTEKQFEEIEKIQKAHKEKMQTAHKAIRTKTEEEKNQVAKELEQKYRDHEKVVNEKVIKSKKEIEKEIETKREQVLTEAESLANSLVEKMTKGV